MAVCQTVSPARDLGCVLASGHQAHGNPRCQDWRGASWCGWCGTWACQQNHATSPAVLDQRRRTREYFKKVSNG